MEVLLDLELYLMPLTNESIIEILLYEHKPKYKRRKIGWKEKINIFMIFDIM